MQASADKARASEMYVTLEADESSHIELLAARGFKEVDADSYLVYEMPEGIARASLYRSLASWLPTGWSRASVSCVSKPSRHAKPE